MDPIYIPGSGYYGSGTDMEPASHSLSSTGYRRETEDYGVKWMHNQDLIDSGVRASDYLRELDVSSSPGSSIHQMPTVKRQADSAVSSWPGKSPSGMHCRPEFPVSSSLVWDLLEAQDNLLRPYDEVDKKHPVGFRDYWKLPTDLAALTPPLLSTNGLIVNTPSDAEALYDCLTHNGVVTGKRNQVSYAYTAKKLEDMLERRGITLSDKKLKKLEWLLGLLYDLNRFNRQQFEEIHEPVWLELWNSMYYQKATFGSFFGYGPFNSDKGRSGNRIYEERDAYWKAERTWQIEHYGADRAAFTTPSRPRPTTAVGALTMPALTAQNATTERMYGAPRENNSASTSRAASARTVREASRLSHEEAASELSQADDAGQLSLLSARLEAVALGKDAQKQAPKEH